MSPVRSVTYVSGPDTPTAWWSSSDSNQPPKRYGTWGCSTSSPGRTPCTRTRKAPFFGHFQKRGANVGAGVRRGELVGLEPSTKALWNIGSVRPAYPVEHQIRSQEPPEEGRSSS